MRLRLNTLQLAVAKKTFVDSALIFHSLLRGASSAPIFREQNNNDCINF